MEEWGEGAQQRGRREKTNRTLEARALETGLSEVFLRSKTGPWTHRHNCFHKSLLTDRRKVTKMDKVKPF